MTIVDHDPRTADDVLQAARGLGPAVADRAPEIEAGRRVPPDLLRDLLDAGCFRLLLPHSHGGVGSDLPQALDVFEVLARADASVGWTVMIGAAAWCDLTGLPRTSFAELMSEPDVIVAGAFNPTAGSTEPVADGYRVTGRWGFASGCEHATWLFGNCIEGVVDGHPRLRAAVFAPDQVVIEDTWNASGLRGTGSHHFHVRDVVVAADRTFVPLVDEPCLDATIARFPPPALISLCIASVAVGTAAGAMDDIVALATHKVPLLADARLASDPSFQMELASADTTLAAAGALLRDTAGSAWSTLAERDELTMEQRARIRAAAVWVVESATAVVDAAYRAGGGTSVYADCPLQRRLRDIHTLTQHFLVKRATLTTAGAILAGQDVRPVVF